jgi:hypothetical protein
MYVCMCICMLLCHFHAALIFAHSHERRINISDNSLVKTQVFWDMTSCYLINIFSSPLNNFGKYIAIGFKFKDMKQRIICESRSRNWIDLA